MVAEKQHIEDESLRIDCAVLATERLVMRTPQAADIPALALLANNRAIAEMVKNHTSKRKKHKKRNKKKKVEEKKNKQV